MLGFILIVVPLSVASIVIFANLLSDLGDFIDPHDWEDIYDEQYEDWEDDGE